MAVSDDHECRAGVGRRLRAARMRRGWSRETLAHTSGISWSAITQIEAGRRTDIRATSVVALADALGVTVDYLLNGAAESPPLLEHRAMLYSSDEECLAAAIPFLTEGDDCPSLVVASTANLKMMKQNLGRRAKGVVFRDSSRWYTTPADSTAGYQRFILDSVKAGATWVRVIGEPVWAKRSASQTTTWIRYESLLNTLFALMPATVLCPYDARTTPKPVLASVRKTHPEVIDGAGLQRSAEYRSPEQFLLT